MGDSSHAGLNANCPVNIDLAIFSSLICEASSKADSEPSLKLSKNMDDCIAVSGKLLRNTFLRLEHNSKTRSCDGLCI